MLVLAVGVGAAGCGDSKPPKTASTGSIDTRTHVSLKKSLLGGQAGFLLSVDSAPVVRGQGPPDQGFGVAKFSMDPSRREVARFHYLRPTGRRLPVDIVDGDTFKFRRRVSIPAH